MAEDNNKPVYRLEFTGAGDDYATLYLGDRLIEPIDGLFMASDQDREDLDRLVRLANRGLAQLRSELSDTG